MALPVFRGAGAKAAGTTAVSPASVPSIASGWAVGDLEIMVAESNSVCTIANSGGSAWTEMTGSPITYFGGRLTVWWRITQAGDSAPSLQDGGTPDHVCAVRLFYQAGTFDTSDPFEVETTGAEPTSDTSFSFAPGVSTSDVDRLVLCISASTVASNTPQVPVCTNAALTGLVSRANYQTLNGNGGGFGITEGVLAAAGPVGTFACTYVTASTKAYIVFALKPVGVLAATIPLDPSAATSGATLALSAPTTVPLAASAAASGATLALRAPTTVVLAASSASSGASLALTAPAIVPLSSSATSGASLALRAPTTVALGSSGAVSGASLALTAPTRIALASSGATSGATLFLATTNVPLISATAAAQSGATLALTAPAIVPLGAASASSSSTLALTAPTKLTLTSAAVSSSTLALSAPTTLNLGPSSATSTATLTLSGPARLVLAAGALSDASLAIRVPVRLALGPSVATSSASLVFKLATQAVGPLGVVEPILATGGVAELVTGVVGPAWSTGALASRWATGATGTSTRTGAAQPADTGAVELVTP